MVIVPTAIWPSALLKSMPRLRAPVSVSSTNWVSRITESTGMSISAIWSLIRAIRSGVPVIQIALRRRSIARPVAGEGLAERHALLLRLVLAADIIGLVGRGGRAEAGLAADEDVVGLDRLALDEQADHLADVGIFERHQLVGIAGRIDQST